PVGKGIAMLSQGVPRNAMSLLDALQEVAIARYGGYPVDGAHVYGLLKSVVVFQSLDPLLGLPMSYRRVLMALDAADGATIGLSTLASKAGEVESTVRDAIEPYLLSKVEFSW